MKSPILIVGAIVVGVVAVIAAYPLWSPLFSEDVVVDEPFPELTDVQRDRINEMPQDQQDELFAMAEEDSEMASQTALAMMEDDTVMDEDMPPDAPMILATGRFGEFDPIHSGSGSATVYELADGTRFVRLEDFSTNNGPELRVYLTTNAPNNIRESVGDFIDLGPLKGTVGNQNYFITEDINIEDYAAVVIYCVPFNINFTVAAFE